MGSRLGTLRLPALALALALSAGLCLIVLAGCDNGAPPAPALNTPTAVAGPEQEGGSPLLTSVASVATATTPPTPAGLTEEDAANIYAVAVDALLGERVPNYVYLGQYVSQGERLDDPNESHPLPPGLMGKLKSSAGGTTYDTQSFEDAIGPLDEGGKVINSGVYISLGDITADPSNPDAVVVRGSAYRSVGEAEGDRFTLVRDSSVKRGWKVSDQIQEWVDK